MDGTRDDLPQDKRVSLLYGNGRATKRDIALARDITFYARLAIARNGSVSVVSSSTLRKVAR